MTPQEIATESVDHFTFWIQLAAKERYRSRRRMLGADSDRAQADREVQDAYRRLVRWNQGLTYSTLRGWHRP